ncbi:MAG: type II toxin-antitoxin system VapC family toxin [Acidobacteriaceae bacterium]
MDKFSERIKPYPILGLDTSVFIYHFESHSKYVHLTRELFSGIETGKCSGITSTITLMEILIRPLSLGALDVARKYETLLVSFPHLEMIDLDRDIIRRAAQIRADYHLRTPDALQISACLAKGARAFITNDRLLERLKEQIDIIILDDF